MKAGPAVSMLVGKRQRTRYEITSAGRAALAAWLQTPVEPPRFEVEGVLRLLFAENGSIEDLRSALRATAEQARATLDDGLDMAEDYWPRAARSPSGSS